jgi:ferrous iron transport protein B
VRRLLGLGRRCECDACPLAGPTSERKLMLVGAPNVGKSVIFNQLTGSYVVVSNYPGTTVEIARGKAGVGEVALDVLDSPGAYSLVPLSQEERVTLDLLLDDPPDLVLHVVDAKNLPRMLPLTFQLIEAGVPVALDVNIVDEAERAGITVDSDALSNDLGLPVIPTAAVDGVGVDQLRAQLGGRAPDPSAFRVAYPAPIEAALDRIGGLLNGEYRIAPRAMALLLLQRESGVWARVTKADPEAMVEVERVVGETERQYNRPLSLLIALARQKAADRVAGRALAREPRAVRPPLGELAGRLAMHPIIGVPILAAVLYVGLYLVVGKIGAGVLVDFLETQVFERYVNPFSTALVERILPWPTWSALFVGEYGVITLGVRYALAIVLPLVAAFFLVFALLEDSGYLPRLALLLDRLFKRIGLSGRAVIPIVLGLGCDTMATLVTRVLETRRERVIATFLLALAIPCSAQLGVILGLLSTRPLGMAIWVGVVSAVFLLSGYLAARLVPGEAARFYLDIPPMRWPSLRNVAAKTLARVRWYAAEVIPIFLLASVFIWIAQLTRLLEAALAVLRPVVGVIGLPGATADAFLFGFLRRDYGAARIFDAHTDGALSGVPLVVAMVTITLFVPCIAHFLIMVKERGLRTAVAVAAIILPFAFGVGYLLNLILITLKVQI